MCRSMVDIQSPPAEIRRGKEKKKKEEGKKLQDENIYGLPITQGDHKRELRTLMPRFIMAAICNRGDIIFLPCDFFLSVDYGRPM